MNARRTSAWYRAAQVLVAGLIVGFACADEIHVLWSMRKHPDATVIPVFLAVFLGAWIGTVIAHELGHLVGALLMGLRVGHIRLLPGGRGARGLAHVNVVPRPGAVAMPARIAVMALAGPAANIGIAVFFRQLADRHGVSAEQHGLLLLPVILGLGVGAGNLVPLHARGRPSDGWQVFAWLLRRGGTRRNSMKDEARLKEYLAEIQRGGVPDLSGLRAIADYGEGTTDVAAATVLMAATMRAGIAEFTADIPRFVRAARNPRMRPETAASMGGRVAWVQGLEVLRRLIGRTAVDPERVAEIAALAEFAYGKDRSSAIARCALGLIRLLQNRPAEARGLLVGADDDARTDKERADLLAVRALVEVTLGDFAQSRRLIEAARRLGVDPAIRLPLIEAALAGAEKRRAAQQDAATESVRTDAAEA